jgi:aminoglycoside phosphotransferase family enzyme/predicted kinase
LGNIANVNGFDVAESHISWLLFTPDHVFKVKKPVTFGFLDLSTVEARLCACLDEVELNRRLAPDVYEGVGTFTYPDGRCEPVVVMRRLDSNRRLSALVRSEDPAATIQVERIARRLAAFHAGASRGAAVDVACTDRAVAELWRNNMGELRDASPGILDPKDLDRIEWLARRYLSGRSDVFDQRIRSGRAVDGHGDLLADDIFCLDDGPRLLDCLEFDGSLRYVDTLSDAASLAMDLERLGRPDLAAAFLDCYREAAVDNWPESLAHFYIAYRSTIRAKVACLRAASGDDDGPDEARRLTGLALAHLGAASVRLVLVGGLPGTGKSTLAGALSAATGWPLLRSDVLRKELAGLRPGESAAAAFRAGMYGAEATASVYAELLARAAALLRSGRSVILDATWTRQCWRDAAEELGQNAATDVVGLQCEASRELSALRLVQRRIEGMDASDATPGIADAMAQVAEPWLGALPIDTSGVPEDALAAALQLLDWACAQI